MSEGAVTFEYWLVAFVIAVARMPHGAAVPLILYQIVTVSPTLAGVMDPLMVVFSPVVMVVGEAVIEMEPLSIPVLTWAAINVKTSM